jgi:hypothetical protein
MGNGVIRRLSAAAVLAAGLLGTTAIVTTPESKAHTCARMSVKYPTTIHVLPDATCTNHHNLNDPGSCTIASPAINGTTLLEVVVCVARP